MHARSHLNSLLPLLLLGGATAAEAQVQPDLAERYFEEATKLCERDAGQMWGVPLGGPMVIFDAATGTRVTSQPEPEGQAPWFSSFADGPVSCVMNSVGRCSGSLPWLGSVLVLMPPPVCWLLLNESL